MTLRWAWRASKQVDRRLRIRFRFLAAALQDIEVSKQLALADPGSPLGELLIERPETVGILLWPYQNAAWNPKTRLTRICEHVDAIRHIAGLKLGPDEKLILVDLSSFSPGVSLMLDRPPWLSREGQLTLSLFKDEFRAFTVSFSLFGFPNTEMFIGGIQGRQSEEILALYRDLTKDFAGMRPRDFLLEALRLLAGKIGVQNIHAVADEHTIARHKYFAGKEAGGFSYNEVWLERGANRVAPTHFELPLAGSRRALEDVSAKKRSMYRRRYEMLDAIDAAMPRDLTTAELRRFDAQ